MLGSSARLSGGQAKQQTATNLAVHGLRLQVCDMLLLIYVSRPLCRDDLRLFLSLMN